MSRVEPVGPVREVQLAGCRARSVGRGFRKETPVPDCIPEKAAIGEALEKGHEVGDLLVGQAKVP